MIYLSAE